MGVATTNSHWDRKYVQTEAHLTQNRWPCPPLCSFSLSFVFCGTSPAWGEGGLKNIIIIIKKLSSLYFYDIQIPDMILSYLESVVSLVYHDVAHHCCWEDNRYKLLLFLSKTSFYIQINTRVFQLLSSRPLLGKFIMELRLNITKTKEIWRSDFLSWSTFSQIVGHERWWTNQLTLQSLGAS